MKDPSFNSDFYVTAATVIPVLYLALAVQGPALDEMIRWLSRLSDSRAFNRAVKFFGVLGVGAFTGYVLIQGELHALRDLYNQKAPPGDGLDILGDMDLLVFAIVAVTLARVAWIFREADKEKEKKDAPSGG
jgi:hypothetical protein